MALPKFALVNYGRQEEPRGKPGIWLSYTYFLSQVEAVLSMLDVLVKDQPDQTSPESDLEDFMEEQGLLARHVLYIY